MGYTLRAGSLSRHFPVQHGDTLVSAVFKINTWQEPCHLHRGDQEAVGLPMQKFPATSYLSHPIAWMRRKCSA